MKPEDSRVPIQGSHKSPLKGARFLGRLDPNERLEVSARARGRQKWAGTPECAAFCAMPPNRRRYLARAEFAKELSMGAAGSLANLLRKAR